MNIIWIMYKFNRNKKNPFEQKLANFKVFYSQKLISQKLTECVNFWAKKLTLWERDTISLLLFYWKFTKEEVQCRNW